MTNVEMGSVNAAAKWRMSARILAIFIVFIMVSTAFAAFLASADETPGIWTSKDEYSPGETVEIYGGGFVKWVPVTITISHPDIVTKTYNVTPDMYGRFVCTDYVAEVVNSYNISVTVTATQVLQGGNRVATTNFWDPAAYIEGWTLMPHAKFTTGDVKGYNEGDSVPMIVVLSKKQLHANAVTMSIGVDFIDTTPLHVPTYGIDYLTQYWLNPPVAPFNTYTNSSSPFYVSPSSGTLSGVHRDPNVYDAGHHITEQVWTFTFTFSSSACTATIRFGAHLAVSDVPNGIYGASYYPGESLHVRIVAMDPDVNNGNRDVPISVGQLLGPPEMSLTKECDPEIVVKGDIITFTVCWNNTGQGDATCVNIWDNLPGPGVVYIIPGSFLYWDTTDQTPMHPIPGPTLTSGGWSWFIGQVSGTGSPPKPFEACLSFQGLITTDQEGTYTNWVHLTYSDGHGGLFPQLDANCSFQILGHPSISIVKSGPAYAHVGDTITYTYTVTNTGNVTLVSVDVVDNVAGNVQLGFTLLPHQTVTLTKTYTIKPGDPHFLTNTVTATGTDTHGRIVTSTSHWTVEILNPHILITKTSDWSCAKVGETVWYTITWSNPALYDTTLYNVTVKDPMLMALPISVGTLPPGAGGQVTIAYTITGQWGDPQINTATAYGEDIIHGTTLSTASVRIDILHPAVQITKTADKACAKPGELVTYTITVTNPGTADVWLNGSYGDTQLGLTWTFSNLKPGESIQQVVSFPMPDMNDFINNAWVKAQDYQLHVVSGSASLRVDVVHPKVLITKTADRACAAVGEVVKYTITVTNPATADVWLNGTVNDPTIASNWFFTNLKPGQHLDFIAFYAMPAGQDDFVNTATVVAHDHQQHEVSGSASFRVDILHPMVKITKVVDQPCAAPGELRTFTINVTNPTGADVWLNGTVSDPKLGMSWSFFDLMPGQMFQKIVTMPMPAGADDYVNTATVDAFDYQLHEVTGSASVRVDILHPSVKITKTVDQNCAAVGEVRTFTITVISPATSDVWLNGTYGDSQLGVSWSFQNLMPGQSVSQVVQAAMPDVDVFYNAAWVDAFDHQNHEVRGEASVRVDVVHPAITITKIADRTLAHEGDTITYTITVGVPSTADEWMNGTVTDARLGFSGTFLNLKPGQSITWTVSLLVTSQTERVINNTAMVVAIDEQGHVVTGNASWTVTILRPLIHVTKIGPLWANVGQLITYFVNVTNTGNCDLYNVLVNDSLYGALPIIPFLAKGATVHLTYQLVVPAGSSNLVNIVTATGQDLLGLPVSDKATWTVMKYSTIEGFKAADLNQNGQRDQGEPGLMNWFIVLTGVLANGTPILPQVQQTDSFGHYKFTNLTTGTYQVSEIMQTGWKNYSAQSYTRSLGSGMSLSLDFLNLPFGNICGAKFEDSNMNGVWDVGEHGVQGWNITLTGTTVNGDLVLETTTTDALGHYCFTKLIPGVYYISEEEKAGWFPTTPSPLVVDVSALEPFNITDQNFGNAKYGMITGFKWLDLNMNGYWDGAEPKLPGWTIVLDGYQTDGTHVHMETVTDANGNYAFLNLKPGVYTVTEVMQSGWINITPSSREITIIEGSDVPCAKFGNVPLGSICGWKFYDWDLDQMKDGNEPGIPGWKMTLTGWLSDGIPSFSQNGATPVGPIVVYTDANGVWCFNNLLPGEYFVTEEQVNGWHNTTPIQLHFEVTAYWLLNPQCQVLGVWVTHVIDVKFGNVPLICINGTKFNDLNGNGVRDPGEPGIPWVIVVSGGPNNIHQTVLTDTEGNYELCGLLPGMYLISEVSRDGWMNTTPREYLLDACQPREPITYTFDFGNFQLGKITGSKWEDMNGDGILDAGDMPIQGWTIYLDKVGGGTISTTTDANGNFEFDNLMAGQYTVREETRANWLHMGPSSYDVTIVSGTSEQLPPFLNVHLSTIKGCKFNDLNGNGIRDPNEPGIGGWTIYLVWDSDPTIYSTTTDENGCYWFSGAMPGPYMVWENQLPDWTPTNQTWEEFTLVSGTNYRVHDFGNFHNTVITLFKYNDNCGNGLYDDHDTPLSGWHFIVAGPGIPGGSVEVVTDASGYASLTVTAAGVYTVTEIEQAGWTPTTPTVQTVTVTSGFASPPIVIFGNFKCVDITLFKYEDVNSNGVYDQGVDNPIEGWTFTLTSWSGQQITAVTDADGYVHLHFCAADKWFVSEEHRDGWIPVNPDNGRAAFFVFSGHAFACPSGLEQYLYQFGNFNLVQICVFKFWDKCSDGYYTPGVDEPLPGWLIELYDSQGNLVASGYTNSDGWICFTLAKAGTYLVKEQDRAGWSHIMPLNGSWTVDVVSGDDLSLEFANYQDVKVPIFKYEDVNCDGVYDNGDVPIAGWHFDLVRTGDLFTYSGVTDANGMLTIIVNRSGLYRLTEELRSGWTPVNPADGKVLISITSGTVVPLQEFGNFHNVLIPIFKYSDADGNGYYDPASGDSPLEGWHFYLWKWNETEDGWDLVGANVTDVNGRTEFIVTDCGQYAITEEHRDGWFVISPYGGQYFFTVESGYQYDPFCFANFKLGTITVYKWNDLNGNGVWDQGEPGLPGWTIEIQSQGPFFWYEFGTTDANGTCVFTGLPPGWYTVWEDGQTGWVATNASSVNVQVVGDTHAVVNFFNFEKGCIQGYKYNDVNGNGVYDPGIDTPLEGWQITLAITTGIIHTPDGDISAIAIVGVTHTDANGFYEFCDLGPGLYIVYEEQKQPWVPMTPTSYGPTLLLSGGTIEEPPFLNFAPGSICGYKYEDVNCNGVYDPGIDRPIEGWKITMYEDSLPDPLVTYTNADGYWCFENLKADYYLVYEEGRDHWTAESKIWAEVTITSGLDYEVAPFLNFHNVSIPIFKYEDVNGDGIYEPGIDVPIEGWTFTVTGPGLPGGSATVQTGQNGWVSVEVNCTGIYTVTEAEVLGWNHTTPSSLSVYLQSGDVLDPLMFGNFNLGRVYGFKIYDYSLTANAEGHEGGLGNWEIVLTGFLVNGDPILPRVTYTDSNGYYEFHDLKAGSYSVSEIIPPGWVPITPPSVHLDVVSGTDQNITFDNALYGIIEGYKFYDKNMNAAMDPSEPGLAGWVVHLDGVTDYGAPVHMVTTTDGSGHYAFSVQPGHYLVTEELPGSGWMATTPSPQVDNTNGTLVTFDHVINIGNVRFATIWGYKFLDTYCQSYPFWPNGVFDPWEVGIGNWRITLQGYTDTGVRVDLVQYTDDISDIGHFAFTQVLPGTYWLNETLQSGFAATTPYANLLTVYPFPQGPVVIRHDFGNLLPSADPTMPFLLEKGWNLWSSPLKVTGMTAKSLLSSIGPNGVAVTRLDTSQGKYFSYLNVPGATDFPIVLGQGYYVLVSHRTSFTLTGEIEQSSSTQVLKGWNIVGYTKLQPVTASQLLASVTGCHARAITYLDAATGTYHSFVAGIGLPAAYDFTVTQGRSYFLLVDGAGTLTI